MHINLNARLQILTRLELNVNESFGTRGGNHITFFRMYLTGNQPVQWTELWRVFGYLSGRGRREGKNTIVFLISVLKRK